MAIPAQPGIRLAAAPLSAPTSTNFTYPREYHYPPFFTRQPISSTLHAQLQKWSTLLLGYYRSSRQFRVSLSDALSQPPFSNPKLGKKLDLSFAREIIDHMRAQGRAEWITSGSGRDKVADGDKNVAYVFWKNLEEWGQAIWDWVDETGQKNTVLTLYEITEGEMARGREWEGMEEELLKRVLGSLVKRGKAQVFSGTDGAEGMGVKFF